MRHSNRWFVLGSSLAVGFGAVVLAGDLTPPAGPVASTMKDLDEVEPRIAVNATNTPGDVTNTFIINQPGSYYFDGNITGESGKNGILIHSVDVTLDLSGFTLRGRIGSLDGINMIGFRRNIVIQNGFVTSWGGSGINTQIDFGRIEKIVVTDNSGWGIDNGTSGTFNTRIIQCQADANGTGVVNTGGIRGGSNSVIQGCVVWSNTGAGIQVSFRGTVRDNVCELSKSDAILGSIGREIYVTGRNNLIDGNSVVDSVNGIVVAAPGNAIIRNAVTGGTTPYNIVAGNDVGPIGSAATSTSPWANIQF